MINSHQLLSTFINFDQLLSSLIDSYQLSSTLINSHQPLLSLINCHPCLTEALLIFIQDKEIYLLDDPLAAVDTHVASHIFTHCIMGVLKHKTRILCTHHWKYLHGADVIVVMEHGRIVCVGAPHEVLKEDTLIRKISTNGKSS